MTTSFMKSRAASMLLLALALVLVCSACCHVQSSQGARAMIECERPENGGFLNIVPCTVAFSDGQTRTLDGGEQIVVKVGAGSHWIAAFSADPYRPEPNRPKAWRSSRIRVDLGP